MRRMTRATVAVACTLLALCAALAAPSAHADGLSGVSGWEPVPNTCGGPSNIVPVLVTNATNVTQTGSVTIGPGLTAQAAVFPSYAAALDSPFGVYITSNGTCPGRPELQSAPAYQVNFTVAPGQTTVWWLAVGGMDYNLIGDTHNIAVGGLPSGTPGQAWYDFYVWLGLDDNFQYLQLEYHGTGGINTDNNQNGFNVVACNTANGNLTPTTNVLSPYVSGYPSTWPQYQFGQPICLGWLPTGTMLPLSSASFAPGSTIASVTAIQYNPTGPSINVQGTLTPGLTNVTMGVGSAFLQNGLGASGGSFVTNGNAFVIEGVPITCNQQDIAIDGVVNGLTRIGEALEITNIPNMPNCPTQ